MKNNFNLKKWEKEIKLYRERPDLFIERFFFIKSSNKKIKSKNKFKNKVYGNI